MTTKVSPLWQAAQGETKAWPVAVGAGQTVVDVDPVIADAERGEAVALRGQILLLCGTRAQPTRSWFINTVCQLTRRSSTEAERAQNVSRKGRLATSAIAL